MKKLWKKLIGKSYAVGVGALIVLSPTMASAADPATYVNKATNEIFNQISSISYNVALVALIIAVLAYIFAGGDDHKKAKIKWTGVTVVLCLLIIGVLPDLVTWAQTKLF